MRNLSLVASTRTDILVRGLMFPEKVIEMLNLRNVTGVLQKNATRRTLENCDAGSRFPLFTVRALVTSISETVSE